jgi:hypothetical protein
MLIQAIDSVCKWGRCASVEARNIKPAFSVIQRIEEAILFPAIRSFNFKVIKQAAGLPSKACKVFLHCIYKRMCCGRKSEPNELYPCRQPTRLEQLHHLDALLSSSVSKKLIKEALLKLPVHDRNEIFHYIWIAHGGRELGKNVLDLDKQNKFGESFFKEFPNHPSVKAAVKELFLR